MRRASITAIAGFIGIAGLLVWLWPDGKPFYRPFKSSDRIPAHIGLSYLFLSSNPFQNGQMWISLRATTNSGVVYRFDIEQRKVMGELRNGYPSFEPEPGVTLLCMNRMPPGGIRHKLGSILARVTGGRLQLPAPTDNHTETFWLLNLKNNSAVVLGTTEQFPGGGSSFIPSPDGRLAFNKPTADLSSSDVPIFNATIPAISKVSIRGWPIGWWSNREILHKQGEDFMLHDVPTGRAITFISLEQLRRFIEKHNLSTHAKDVSIFPMWNGREYDFYFTEGQSRWKAVESYLAKVQRPHPTLQLIAPVFKFEWSDSFDDTTEAYVFSGRRSGDGSSAVRKRDMSSGRVMELVPDDGGARYFSVPNPYRDNVIYVRSNALWRTRLTGSNTVRLFPP